MFGFGIKIFLSLFRDVGHSPLDHMMLNNVWRGFVSSVAASLKRQIGVGRYTESDGKPLESLFKFSHQIIRGLIKGLSPN